MSFQELERDLERLQRERLPQIIEAIDSVAVGTSPAGSSLVDMLRYHFETGGKRLRGVLPLLVTELLGGEVERAIPFGAACEMLHNATLVHDDLQDGDTHRRGRVTVWKRYGEAQAINLGDAMFYYTLMLIRRIEGTPELRESLYERAMLDTLEVIDGQEREFALKSKLHPTLDDYFAMVDGKTSALIALSLSGGAMLAGAGERTVEPLRRAAHHLGILFQIQDDVLDLYGDKGRERVGEDVAEGKRSLLAVHALGALPEPERERLRTVLDLPREDTTVELIEEAKASFERAGSLDFALDEIERRREAAIGAAARTGHRNLVRLAEHLADLFLRPIASITVARTRRAPADEAFLIRMLPEVSRTFALSIEALPEPLRGSVRTAYLLCRVVDTIEDSAHLSPARRQALFDRFDAALDDEKAAGDVADAPEWEGRSEPDYALCRGARQVFRAFANLDPELRSFIRDPILEMSSGMREYSGRADRDGRVRIRDVADLDRYCYFVAGTVGQMLTSLFLWFDREVDSEVRAEVEARAIEFGQGLQLVNVLKDIIADHGRGVCYLPEDELGRRGVQAEVVLQPGSRDAVLEVVRLVSARARTHLDRAIEYTLTWPSTSEAVRYFCSVPLGLALATLHQVENGDDALQPGREPKVSRSRVLWLLEEARTAVRDDGRLRDLFGEIGRSPSRARPTPGPERRFA